jgi:replicative DNA helicase
MSATRADVLPMRSPPHNIQAELALLGSCMLDRSVVDEVSLVISGSDFWRDTHALLWDAITALNDLGLPTDPVAVADRLKRSDAWEAVGETDIFGEIDQATPHAVNGPYLAQVIRQLSIKRQLFQVASDISRAGYERSKSAQEVLDEAERRIFAIADRQVSSSNIETDALIGESMSNIAGRSNGQPRGLMTGFDELDYLLDGLKSDDFVILAARPSQGKSAMALSIASKAALNLDASVLFASLEMNRQSLGERLLSSWSGVDAFRLKRSWTMNDANRLALNDAANGLSAAKMTVDDGPNQTASQIAANARRIKAQRGLDLIVIDYLSLIDMQRQKGENRQEEVARTSRRLKSIARELKVPVLCLHQLNRQSEQREDKRPRLADLRESGQIEQDADTVLLLHRPEYYDPNDQPGIAEIIVAKNRNGPTGTVKLMFTKHCTRFDSLPEAVPAKAF